MPAGSVPSWAVTSSSSAIFGGGSGSKANGRAAADANLASSTSASTSASQQPPSKPDPDTPLRSVNHDTSAATAGENEKPYVPKRKQRSIAHCPPLTSVASSSRIPYSIPYVDESSANEALHQLIAVQAKGTGYDATTATALHEVSQLTKKFLTSVFSAATHAAELSNRGQPSARDLVYALETHGQPIRELRDFHRQQLQGANEEDERKQAGARARRKARESAKAPQIYKTTRSGSAKSRLGADAEHREDEDWTQDSNAFLPSDSDDGSEMDAWSVSSDSDDEHGNRRAAVHARVMKRKHDLARTLAKKQRRQDKLRPSTTGEVDPSSSSASSSARDLRALTSGEQAWRRVVDHIVPRHLPGMPPRHAWMQTPAFPTNAYGSSLGGIGDDDDEASKGRKDALLLVNRKLANARLVEASLRRLIQNTDGAAAVAYSASTTRTVDGGSSARAEKETAKTSVPATVAASAATPTSGGFAVPKTPASVGGGSGLTLRLNRKISLPASSLNSPSQPSTPLGSRRPSIITFNNAAASAAATPGTPLGMSFGWGGEPLMSPLTPVSATAITPYPPTPGGVYGHYFGSNPNTVSAAGAGGNRSRSQSVVAGANESYGGADTATDQMGIRVPGPVNYKNVWYAPGSTIASGGLAGTSTKAGNHPRSVKRMRKWKV